MKVIGFLTEQELQNYMLTKSITKDMVVSIFFNGASGRIVLVHTVA